MIVATPDERDEFFGGSVRESRGGTAQFVMTKVKVLQNGTYMRHAQPGSHENAIEIKL